MSITDEKFIKLIDSSIEKIINDANALNSKLYDSIKYSLFTGGKRIRPLLCLRSYEIFNSSFDRIIPLAASIELIHTYSLIHDDLPSMDDDDVRRGKPTNHKMFGEGFAILAGDALLNLAFENMLNFTYNSKSLNEYKRFISAAIEISKYAGCSGMIGGQAIDLLNEFDPSDETKLISMYRAKTSGLIEAALVTGAIIGEASDKEVEALRKFGRNIGLAYQIRDDILDYEEDKDIDKFTYLNYYSKDEAKEEISRLGKEAIEHLKLLENKDISYFIDITKKLSTRDI